MKKATKKTVTKKDRRTYRSDILASVHEAATGLESAGVINRQTMREFDELCLAPVSAPRREGHHRPSRT